MSVFAAFLSNSRGVAHHISSSWIHKKVTCFRAYTFLQLLVNGGTRVLQGSRIESDGANLSSLGASPLHYLSERRASSDNAQPEGAFKEYRSMGWIDYRWISL